MTKISSFRRQGSNSNSGEKGQFFLSSSSAGSADEKMPFILAASRQWDETKNMSNLEAVAPLLPWPIYVAGQKGASSDPASHSLNMLGRLDFEELQFWFASASIYVQMARCEPSHLSILRAARAGCALVLSDLPSLRRTWGNAVLYVPPDDLEALEVALVLLIADSIYRTMMAQRALVRVQKFASERKSFSYLSIYPDWIGSYPQRAS